MSSPKLHHNSEAPAQINETKMRRKLLKKRRRSKKKVNNNDSDDENVPLSSIPGFQEEKRESGVRRLTFFTFNPNHLSLIEIGKALENLLYPRIRKRYL